MAGGLDGEISKLRHRDIRERRRAVRVLFDTDLPRALTGFVPLLNDKDPWFRSKALEAHRRWSVAMGPESLKVLAEHRSIEARRCAANLLGEFEKDVTAIALLLVEDNDLTCRRKSAGALLSGSDAEAFVERFLSSEDPYLRRLAIASHGANAEQRRQGLDDASSAVCEVALQAMNAHDEALNEAAMLNLLARGIDGSTLIDSAVQNPGQALVELAQQAKGPTMKRLVSALKNACTSQDDLQIQCLLEAEQHSVVGRWLQGKRSSSDDELRWRLLRIESIDQIERSRWIERLLGRCGEEELIDEARVFLTEDHPQLLLDAAQNLSTAFDILNP
tara:strand:- start:10269 stop:11267 length:999 start_codon:yes stop_codon:yes gene_type:complete